MVRVASETSLSYYISFRNDERQSLNDLVCV
jgi:hypothetical protein